MAVLGISLGTSDTAKDTGTQHTTNFKSRSHPPTVQSRPYTTSLSQRKLSQSHNHFQGRTPAKSTTHTKTNKTRRGATHQQCSLVLCTVLLSPPCPPSSRCSLLPPPAPSLLLLDLLRTLRYTPVPPPCLAQPLCLCFSVLVKAPILIALTITAV